MVPVLIVGWLIVLLILPTWSWRLEGRRKAVDRLVTLSLWTAFVLALAPLV